MFKKKEKGEERKQRPCEILFLRYITLKQIIIKQIIPIHQFKKGLTNLYSCYSISRTMKTTMSMETCSPQTEGRPNVNFLERQSLVVRKGNTKKDLKFPS